MCGIRLGFINPDKTLTLLISKNNGLYINEMEDITLIKDNNSMGISNPILNIFSRYLSVYSKLKDLLVKYKIALRGKIISKIASNGLNLPVLNLLKTKNIKNMDVAKKIPLKKTFDVIGKICLKKNKKNIEMVTNIKKKKRY